jgi:hypothetical protein
MVIKYLNNYGGEGETQTEDTDNVYYNVSISNIYGDISSSTIPATISQKTTNVLDQQSNYEMAIYHFALNGNIPLFIFPIKQGINSNINLSNMGVNYKYGGNNYSAPILYDPSIEGANTFVLPKSPLQNSGLQDYSTSYYTVYNINTFLIMVNVALNTAYTAFNAAHPAVHNSPVWVQYDPDTQLISLIGEYSYSVIPTAASIYMSFQLVVNYFNTLAAIYERIDSPIYDDFRMPFLYSSLTRTTGYVTPGSPAWTVGNPPYVRSIQEYPTIFMWNNINRILFFSNSIKTKPEYIPPTISPTLIKVGNISNMSIANPSIIRVDNINGFLNNDVITIINSTYTYNGIGVLITQSTDFIIRNLNYIANTAELYVQTVNDIIPANVTVFGIGGQMYKGNFQSGGNFAGDSRSVISYYDIEIDSNDRVPNWRETIYYTPQTLKWCDLVTDDPLNLFQIAIYLQLNNGATLPLYIETGRNIDIKFQFRKKNNNGSFNYS